MAQEFSRRPLAAEVRVLSQVFQCGIYGRQNGNGTGFSPVASVSFLVSAILTVLHALFSQLLPTHTKKVIDSAVK
jgi:hypothetical protein